MYGFIYPISNWFLLNLNKLNLVELFKWVANLFNKNKSDDIKIAAYKHYGTDVFIILKWILLFVLWKYKITGSFTTFFVWYLIVANLYTYFYHHIWKDTALKTDDFLIARIKRRFQNLMLALAYSVCSFGYLIQVPYSSDFNWGGKPIIFSHALSFSFSNSLAANYVVVQPLTEDGNLICNLELLITFVFVTLIVSRSIPQTNSNK